MNIAQNERERNSRYLLSKSPGIGPKNFQKILDEYPSIWEFLNLNKAKFGKNLIPKLDIVREDIDLLSTQGISTLVVGDKNYPQYLKASTDCPPVVYAVGNLELLERRKMISVVGTRNITEYGRRMVREVITKLVENGFVIVSGMAFGVDRESHIAALNAGGDTIAVLASSPIEPTPQSNTDIYKRIRENGLVLSEALPGAAIERGSFPRRNRIIAGLSLGTIVVEAAESSGSLITANIAFGEGREVFAIPGRVGQKYSAGTNKLIKHLKAKLVETADDILVELGIVSIPVSENKKVVDNLSDIEKKVVGYIKDGYETVHAIHSAGKLVESELARVLGKLEVDGVVVRRLDGGFSLG